MESLGSLLLLALLIAIVLAFARGGLAGVGEWLHVKFVGTAAAG